jgi:hypothetical protein
MATLFRSRFAVLTAVLALTVGWTGVIRAQQPVEEEEKEKALSQKRLELMTDRIGQMTVRWPDGDASLPERLEATPIFKYADPARGLVAAGLWRLGAKGRPLAIISTELQPRYRNNPRIVYEYLSLTPQPFTVTSADTQWAPSASEAEFKPIPDSPAPAENAPQRLIQMRALAKRFTASEVVQERFELRMVPQPIERYVPSEAERADGSMFILAFGLNPEAILFIESDGQQWQYALARLAGAGKMTAEIDGKPAWEIGPPKYGWKNSYTASNSPANIPGIAADGSPIEE